jgi:isopenicillin N synthase-like dioxygenase
VRTVVGEVIVIIGDLLKLGSGGRLYSPVHRVVLPSERGATRTSFTLFAFPRGTDTIASWVRMLETPADVDELLARARERARGVSWNTLLAQSEADSRAHEPFEQILLRKWRGVSTLDKP